MLTQYTIISYPVKFCIIAFTSKLQFIAILIFVQKTIRLRMVQTRPRSLRVAKLVATRTSAAAGNANVSVDAKSFIVENASRYKLYRLFSVRITLPLVRELVSMLF